MFDLTKGFSIDKGCFPIYTYRSTPITNTKSKNNKSYAYIAAFGGIGSIILGGISIYKCKKNIRNKFISYFKKSITEFLNTPQGKPYYNKITESKIDDKHFNIITYYKTIKNNVKQLTEYCQKHPDNIEEKNSLIRLKENLINMETVFINIKDNFSNEYINKSTKYCLKNVVIGGVLGAMTGFCLKIFKGTIGENK